MIQIQHRRGLSSEWTSKNPILAEGELGVETNTLKIKMGDGVTDWQHLPYFTQGAVGPANSITIGTVTSGATSSATMTGTSPLQTLNLVLEQGDAGTITVGTTENKLPGTTAEVNNSGDNKNAVFNFKIPRGTTTAVGTTTTKLPGTSAEVVNSGSASDLILDFKVPRGATVAVGTTTTGDTDTMAAVTNSGTASDLVLDFAIPRGAGVPVGGTAGQILAKTSGTNFDTVWMENYADFTSTVKHNVRAGETLTIGTPVYVTGYTAGNMVVSKASNASEVASSKVMGLTAQALAKNAIGYVIAEGLVQNVNTSAAAIGDPVWLGVSGALLFGVANKPVAPAHLVFIGIVTKIGTTTGEIWCKPQNGFELEELHNVLITNPVNGQALTYQDGKFINSTPASTLNDLSDVVITSPQAKQVLKYDGANFVNALASGGVTVSEANPTDPSLGDGYFYSADGTLFVRYYDGTNYGWMQPNAPLSPQIEQRYYSPNAIINGGFDIWQRGTTFNNVASGAYIADRWLLSFKDAGITLNVSQQTFTPGSAPVAGYEGQYYLRLANTSFTTGNTYYLAQKVEDVRTFAGQTVTLSYWARVSSGTLTPSRVFLDQQFGSGGSAEVDNIGNAAPTYTTTWQRFTQTISVPSVAGKTIGAGSFLYVLWQIVPNANVTLDIWGVQLESGSTATDFRRNANSIQGELAACQRYYCKRKVSASGASGGSSGDVYIVAVTFPVQMRTTPTSVTWYSGGMVSDGTQDKNVVGMYGGGASFVRNASEYGVELLYQGQALGGNARPISLNNALTDFNAEL